MASASSVTGCFYYLEGEGQYYYNNNYPGVGGNAFPTRSSSPDKWMSCNREYFQNKSGTYRGNCLPNSNNPTLRLTHSLLPSKGVMTRDKAARWLD